jgi:hypothetical protein
MLTVDTCWRESSIDSSWDRVAIRGPTICGLASRGKRKRLPAASTVVAAKLAALLRLISPPVCSGSVLCRLCPAVHPGIRPRAGKVSAISCRRKSRAQPLRLRLVATCGPPCRSVGRRPVACCNDTTDGRAAHLVTKAKSERADRPPMVLPVCESLARWRS